MKGRTALLIALVLALLAGAGLKPAPTEESYRALTVTGDFNEPGGDLTEKDIAWHKFTNFFENEHSYLIARLDQGYWIFITIFTFKYGPHQRWGIYALLASDTGEQWFAKREVLPKDAIVSYEDISWESKGTAIKGAYPKYTFTLNEETFQANVVVESRFPGWKLGRWQITPDKKNFGEVFIFIPWGKVSGTITLDGKQIPVTGNAYADRFHASVRYDRADPLFYSIRAVTPLPGSANVSIQASYNHFNPAFGKISIPTLMVMGPDGFIRATQKVTIRGEDFYKDPRVGYSFPRRLVVISNDAGFKLRGVFKAQRNMELLDVISQLPPYIQKLAVKFLKLPAFSKWDGVFEGSYWVDGQETRFKIRATGEINLVGGPEAQETQ